jgi:acyl-coenzyme A thioesterase PaaI-like protein
MYRFLLNVVLPFAVPFNRPHSFKVREVGELSLDVYLPMRRSNKNHLGSLHACSLATAAEMSTGLLLLRHFPFDSYRLIMRSMNMEYFHQGRTSAIAHAEITPTLIESISRNSDLGDSGVMVEISSELFDDEKVLLARGIFEWQLKSWEQVRTL